MKNKVLFSLFLIFVVLTLLFTISASAETVASGSCGTNLTYTLDDQGTLTISGMGAMTEWATSDSVPWNAYRESIKRVSISEGLTVIGNRSFVSFTNITQVNFPKSLESINEYAFFDCDNLTSVNIAGDLKYIGDCAFSGCGNLMEVKLPNNSMYIGRLAFNSCSMASITLPTHVTIDDGAFYNTYNLTDVYYYGTADEWSKNVTISDVLNDHLLNAKITFNYKESLGAEITASKPVYTEGENIEFTYKLPENYDDKEAIYIAIYNENGTLINSEISFLPKFQPGHIEAGNYTLALLYKFEPASSSFNPENVLAYCDFTVIESEYSLENASLSNCYFDENGKFHYTLISPDVKNGAEVFYRPGYHYTNNDHRGIGYIFSSTSMDNMKEFSECTANDITKTFDKILELEKESLPDFVFNGTGVFSCEITLNAANHGFITLEAPIDYSRCAKLVEYFSNSIVPSALTHTFDTTEKTLARDEEFKFNGKVTTTAPDGLNAIQVTVFLSDDHGIGAKYFRKDDFNGEKEFDLSSIVSLKAGDIIDGGTQKLEIKANTKYDIVIYANDKDGNNFGSEGIKKTIIFNDETANRPTVSGAKDNYTITLGESLTLDGVIRAVGNGKLNKVTLGHNEVGTSFVSVTETINGKSDHLILSNFKLSADEYPLNTVGEHEFVIYASADNFTSAKNEIKIFTVTVVDSIVIGGIGIGYSHGDFFTKNGKACNAVGCHNVSVDKVDCKTETDPAKCNCINSFEITNAQGKTETIKLNSAQCIAYARYCSYLVLDTPIGASPIVTGVTKNNVKDTLLKVNPGSYLYNNTVEPNHAIVIVSADNESITFTDANYSTEHCKIMLVTKGWEEFYNYNYIKNGTYSIYGQFKTDSPSAENYTVNFDANGGKNAPPAHIISFGSKTLTLTDKWPERDGYKFKGWSLEKGGNVNYYGTNVISVSELFGGGNHTVTLYAVWENYAYSVVFDSNGGYYSPKNQNIPSTQDTVVLTDEWPRRNGYEFCGWSLKRDGSIDYYGTDEIKISKLFKDGKNTVTLYAVWEKYPYKIVFDANGGYDAPANYDISSDTEKITITDKWPKRIGYKFKGWSLKKGGSVKYYGTNVIDVDDLFTWGKKTVTFYAVWEEIEEYIPEATKWNHAYNPRVDKNITIDLIERFLKEKSGIGALDEYGMHNGEMVVYALNTNYSLGATNYYSYDNNVSEDNPLHWEDDGKKLSPAEIVYYACMENDMNVVFVLSKLQAEQSLIYNVLNDKYSYEYRLNRAMGYPTSNKKYLGFIGQVVGATNDLREYEKTLTEYTMENAYNKYTPPSVEENEPFSSFILKYNRIAKWFDENVTTVTAQAKNTETIVSHISSSIEFSNSTPVEGERVYISGTVESDNLKIKKVSVIYSETNEVVYDSGAINKKSYSLKNIEIDTNKYKSGIYYVNVITSDNNISDRFELSLNVQTKQNRVSVYINDKLIDSGSFTYTNTNELEIRIDGLISDGWFGANAHLQLFHRSTNTTVNINGKYKNKSWNFVVNPKELEEGTYLLGTFSDKYIEDNGYWLNDFIIINNSSEKISYDKLFAKYSSDYFPTYVKEQIIKHLNNEIYTQKKDPNYERVKRNLASGKSVVFFFEGFGSKPGMEDISMRMGAMCVVVQNVGTDKNIIPYISYVNKESTTIPDYVRDEVKCNDGNSVIAIDGIWNIVTRNHPSDSGDYAALKIMKTSRDKYNAIRFSETKEWFVGTDNLNIHARYCNGIASADKGWVNSAGCFNVGMIGTNNDYSAYNEFIQIVTGLDKEPMPNRNLHELPEYKDMGVVIIDRKYYRKQLEKLYSESYKGTDENYDVSKSVDRILGLSGE